MAKKLWSLLVHLEMSMWGTGSDVRFDEALWDGIVDRCAETGINTIVLDLGRGVQYHSHPEISCSWAWSHSRVKQEIRRLKGMGIDLIPKLNFSAVHDAWLGEYERMVSTSVYYRVCRDLIHEVADLFGHPRYFHLGMDEENVEMSDDLPLMVIRQGELLWHDLQFLLDCVRDTGCTPWIWSDLCFNHPEEFRRRIPAEDIVLSPWDYHAIRREHYTPVDSLPEYVEYYGKEPFKSMNLSFVEEDPLHVCFRTQAIPTAKDGYKVVPCVSVFNKCPWNTPDMVEYFRSEAPDESVLGFMTAPWFSTTRGNAEKFWESLRLLKAAREEFYPGQ